MFNKWLNEWWCEKQKGGGSKYSRNSDWCGGEATKEGRLEVERIWLCGHMGEGVGKISRREKLHQHSVQQQALFICILVRGVL